MAITIIALALAGLACIGWTLHTRLLRHELHRAWALLDAARPVDFTKLERPLAVPIRQMFGAVFDVPESDDPGTIVIKYDKTEFHAHVRGVFGDNGENEGVLSVSARLDESPNYPEQGLIIVGAPKASPLLDGYIPDLGGFSCGPEGAERLIAVLQSAVHDVRAGIAARREPTPSSSAAAGTPPPPAHR